MRKIILRDVYQYGGRERVTRKRLLSSESPLVEKIDYVIDYMDKNGIGCVVSELLGNYEVSRASRKGRSDALQYSSTNNTSLPLMLDGGDPEIESQVDSLPSFPAHTIPGPPCYMLFTEGDQGLLKLPILGVVGPRKMSDYGKRVIDQLILIAKQFSCAIISGGAVGVDRYVHEKAMRVGIPIIVVLGGGIAAYHGSSSRSFLQGVIGSGGLILSEFPLREEPKKYTFPLRNRIIAGLSNVLFVPEAGIQSGSLITVDFAIDAGVPVYTATHDIFAHTSKGMGMYLQTGAVKPVVDIDQMMASHFTRHAMMENKKEQITPYTEDIFSATGQESLAGYMGSVSEYLVADMFRKLQ